MHLCQREAPGGRGQLAVAAVAEGALSYQCPNTMHVALMNLEKQAATLNEFVYAYYS